jgi:hypothetical protein
MDFNPDEYETRESFEKRYPNGAEVRQCPLCYRLLVLASDEPYCSLHWS